MSQVSTSQELQAQSEELLQGPLKHARTAALALALVPLAAVAVTTQIQEDQGCPQSAGVCGTVFYDTNGNGIQDAANRNLGRERDDYLHAADGDDQRSRTGRHQLPAGIYETGSHLSWHDVHGVRPDTARHDSVPCQDQGDRRPARQRRRARRSRQQRGTRDAGPRTNRMGIPAPTSASRRREFSNPGTGTPGYWKNHPEAWPVETDHGWRVTYTKEEAIAHSRAARQQGQDATRCSARSCRRC